MLSTFILRNLMNYRTKYVEEVELAYTALDGWMFSVSPVSKSDKSLLRVVNI